MHFLENWSLLTVSVDNPEALEAARALLAMSQDTRGLTTDFFPVATFTPLLAPAPSPAAAAAPALNPAATTTTAVPAPVRRQGHNYDKQEKERMAEIVEEVGGIGVFPKATQFNGLVSQKLRIHNAILEHVVEGREAKKETFALKKENAALKGYLGVDLVEENGRLRNENARLEAKLDTTDKDYEALWDSFETAKRNEKALERKNKDLEIALDLLA